MGSLVLFLGLVVFFFFNDTATTEIYTLSLHDALPIFVPPHRVSPDLARQPARARERDDPPHQGEPRHRDHRRRRSDPEGAPDRGDDVRAAAALRGGRRALRTGAGPARRRR